MVDLSKLIVICKLKNAFKIQLTQIYTGFLYLKLNSFFFSALFIFWQIQLKKLLNNTKFK